MDERPLWPSRAGACKEDEEPADSADRFESRRASAGIELMRGLGTPERREWDGEGNGEGLS